MKKFYIHLSCSSALLILMAMVATGEPANHHHAMTKKVDAGITSSHDIYMIIQDLETRHDKELREVKDACKSESRKAILKGLAIGTIVGSLAGGVGILMWLGHQLKDVFGR